MSIPISQFIPPPPPPPPLSPLGVHTFVLYICVSISALQTGLVHNIFNGQTEFHHLNILFKQPFLPGHLDWFIFFNVVMNIHEYVCVYLSMYHWWYLEHIFLWENCWVTLSLPEGASPTAAHENWHFSFERLLVPDGPWEEAILIFLSSYVHAQHNVKNIIKNSLNTFWMQELNSF